MRLKLFILLLLFAQVALGQKEKPVISAGTLEYNNIIQIFASFATDTIIGIPFHKPKVEKNDVEIKIKSDSYQIHADYSDRSIYVKILREIHTISNPFMITVVNGYSVKFVKTDNRWYIFKYQDAPLMI